MDLLYFNLVENSQFFNEIFLNSNVSIIHPFLPNVYNANDSISQLPGILILKKNFKLPNSSIAFHIFLQFVPFLAPL